VAEDAADVGRHLVGAQRHAALVVAGDVEHRERDGVGRGVGDDGDDHGVAVALDPRREQGGRAGREGQHDGQRQQLAHAPPHSGRSSGRPSLLQARTKRFSATSLSRSAMAVSRASPMRRRSRTSATVTSMSLPSFGSPGGRSSAPMALATRLRKPRIDSGTNSRTNSRNSLRAFAVTTPAPPPPPRLAPPAAASGSPAPPRPPPAWPRSRTGASARRRCAWPVAPPRRAVPRGSRVSPWLETISERLDLHSLPEGTPPATRGGR